MLDENLNIKQILVLPFAKTIWVYYINDGQRHATTYEKINELLTLTVPNLVHKFTEKMIRNLPFLIDVEENELYDVDSKNELEKITDEFKKITINKEDTKPKYTDKVESLINKFYKGVKL